MVVATVGYMHHWVMPCRPRIVTPSPEWPHSDDLSADNRENPVLLRPSVARLIPAPRAAADDDPAGLENGLGESGESGERVLARRVPRRPAPASFRCLRRRGGGAAGVTRIPTQ